MNKEIIIKLVKTELAYCDECGYPSIVGVFELNGWKHTFKLCSRCLEIFAAKILKSLKK